jgi:hypothetical protein
LKNDIEKYPCEKIFKPIRWYEWVLTILGCILILWVVLTLIFWILGIFYPLLNEEPESLLQILRNQFYFITGYYE